jgi:tetratricopeptide (TPR) repeat protein
MKPGLFAFLWLACLLAAGCVTPLDQRRWVSIETDHFQFLTDDDEAKSVQLARDFELFHTFMEDLTGGKKFTSSIPTIVFLFSTQATYRQFAPPYSAGYFSGTGRANYVAVGKDADFSDTRVAFHEYSHYMMRREGLFGYPMWFDEGHAELVGTARVRNGRFEMGLVPKDRIDTLRFLGLMPLRRLIAAKNIDQWSPNEVAQLYATSWGLVHYLYFGPQSEGGTRWAQNAEFLSRLNEGEDVEAAFKAAFGTDFKAMEKELLTYLTRNMSPGISFPIERFKAGSEPRIRVVESAEALTRLSELSFAVGDDMRAERLLDTALQLDPRQPRANALLGRVLARQGRLDEAEQAFSRALAQEPSSALNHLDYASFLTSRAIRRGNDLSIETTDPSAERRATFLKRARLEFERAIALDGAIPEAHTELAFTYLAPGESAELAIAHADRAFALLPSDITIALQLAEVLIAAEKLDEARPLLTRLRTEASRSKKYAAYLDRLLALSQQEDAAAR